MGTIGMSQHVMWVAMEVGCVHAWSSWLRVLLSTP